MSGRLAYLDGVRGVAVLLVLLHHCLLLSRQTLPDRIAYDWIRQAWCGVDLFFVLSGFLITGILIKAKNNSDYYFNFYWRRAVRILPVYYFVLFFALFVWPALPFGGHSFSNLGYNQLWFWLFLSNFYYSFQSAPFSFLHVSWSLCIEEQFYIFWPFIVKKLSISQLQQLLVVILVMSPIVRAACWLFGMRPEALNLLTIFHLDGLACGAFIATLTLSQISRTLTPRFRWGFAVVAIILLSITQEVIHSQGEPEETQLTLVSMVCAMPTYTLLFGWFLAELLVQPKESIFRRAMECPVLALFGRHSYAIYLIHVPIIVVLYKFLPNLPTAQLFAASKLPEQLALFLTASALSLGASLVIWYAFEKRFLDLRDFWKLRQKRSNPTFTIGPP